MWIGSEPDAHYNERDFSLLGRAFVTQLSQIVWLQPNLNKTYSPKSLEELIIAASQYADMIS